MYADEGFIIYIKKVFFDRVENHWKVLKKKRLLHNLGIYCFVRQTWF